MPERNRTLVVDVPDADTCAVGPAGDGCVDPRVARTRETVVAATAGLLAEQGFERITVEAIAERSGVARSTIYRNWPDRAELLIEGFERLCSFSDEPPDSGSLDADLRAIGREVAAGLAETPWGRALPSLVGAVAHDPELQDALRAFSARRRTRVAGIFARARDRGELDPGVDVERLAELFAAPIFYRHLLSHVPIDDDFLGSHVATVCEVATRGRRPRRGARRS